MVEDGQSGLGPVKLGYGNGPVHLDDLGAGARSGRFAGIVQQHQRQQREYLGLVWHQVGQRLTEMDRFGREADPAATPTLVEDQVNDEYGRQPVRRVSASCALSANARMPTRVASTRPH